ncbi:MAG: hypothetical protein KGO96_06475 [Elusimicrobia bacterium]|nr:hypothetical protein [Elusimicrobiota bacterium]MDE2425536.1 hypothetical protein [Elusimicrobiota bacterium]
MKKLFLIAVAPVALSGCITLGHPFSVGHIPSIQISKTTQDQLVSMFGQPYRRGIEDGDATATWLNYHVSAFGSERTRDLYVRFNPNATVKSYSFNSTIPEDQTAIERARAAQ